MSVQGMDADTAETLAGVVGLLRWAAELVWAAADAEGVESPRQVLGLGIDLAGDVGSLLPTRFQSTSLCRSGRNRPLCFAPPSSHFRRAARASSSRLRRRSCCRRSSGYDR
jgi:hypothetical protein